MYADTPHCTLQVPVAVMMTSDDDVTVGSCLSVFESLRLAGTPSQAAGVIVWAIMVC
jgi:hypothetical protein